MLELCDKDVPKVSILIPCFNSEKYLPVCLRSLQNQTLKEIEIICLNDGSKDSTRSILEVTREKDDRFVIINKENSGYGDTLNLGIDIARGDYIGIVEPDDFVESDMFESLYDLAIEHDLDIARCSYFYHTQKEDIKQCWPAVPKGVVLKPLECLTVFKQGPSVWANIYRRSWLKRNSLTFLKTPGASFQDTSFTFKAYSCAQRFMMIDRCLLHYRMDNENSSVHDKRKIFCVMDEWKEIFRFVSLSKQCEIPLATLVELEHRTYLWNLARLDHSGKLEFLKKWHQEARQRKFSNKMKLSELHKIHYLLELFILYCPLVLLLYNKDRTIFKMIKRLAD